MSLRGLRANPELACDILAGRAFAEQPQHLALAQRYSAVGAARPRALRRCRNEG